GLFGGWVIHHIVPASGRKETCLVSVIVRRKWFGGHRPRWGSAPAVRCLGRLRLAHSVPWLLALRQPEKVRRGGPADLAAGPSTAIARMARGAEMLAGQQAARAGNVSGTPQARQLPPTN